MSVKKKRKVLGRVDVSVLPTVFHLSTLDPTPFLFLLKYPIILLKVSVSATCRQSRVMCLDSPRSLVVAVPLCFHYATVNGS